MIIGIDASRAFLKERTGIEEYSYQVIRNLVDKLGNQEVFLYIHSEQKSVISEQEFKLPASWKIKVINFPFFWTQIGLSLEMLFHPVDILFIPAHVIPVIHPRSTIVTIHGLEFEVFPEGYSFWARFYMRWSIRMSCLWAKKIIAVSENTRKDLIRLYKVPEEKIKVIHEGISTNYEFNTNLRIIQNTKYQMPDTKYLLFVGRLEKRKNIEGIVEAYKILKEKYNIPHKLILAGKSGFGFRDTKYKILNTKYKSDIILPGFVSNKNKRELLKNADVFLFPTFYEGFGLPVLEAQNAGVPVVTSNISSLPEIAGESAAYCDPKNPKSIAEAAYKLISNREFRDDIIKKGHENTLKFSWSKSASAIAKLLNS